VIAAIVFACREGSQLRVDWSLRDHPYLLRINSRSTAEDGEVRSDMDGERSRERQVVWSLSAHPYMKHTMSMDGPRRRDGCDFSDERSRERSRKVSRAVKKTGNCKKKTKPMKRTPKKPARGQKVTTKKAKRAKPKKKTELTSSDDSDDSEQDGYDEDDEGEDDTDTEGAPGNDADKEYRMR